MDSQNLWQLFLETGAPEVYLMYHKAMRMEETHVLDDPGIGVTGNGLQ